MNDERVKKSLDFVNKRVQEILEEVPELKDVAVVLNWDPTELAKDQQVPASVILSNRSDNKEMHIQGIELVRLLSDTSMSIQERVISTLIEINSAMYKDLTKMEEKS